MKSILKMVTEPPKGKETTGKNSETIKAKAMAIPEKTNWFVAFGAFFLGFRKTTMEIKNTTRSTMSAILQ
jgi:hypothetical protein